MQNSSDFNTSDVFLGLEWTAAAWPGVARAILLTSLSGLKMQLPTNSGFLAPHALWVELLGYLYTGGTKTGKGLLIGALNKITSLMALTSSKKPHKDANITPTMDCGTHLCLQILS